MHSLPNVDNDEIDDRRQENDYHDFGDGWMETGLLWYDNDPKTELPVKIAQAVVYYQDKYGQKPNLCFVHPSVFKRNASRSGGIEIRPNRKVLPDHLWLGVLLS